MPTLFGYKFWSYFRELKCKLQERQMISRGHRGFNALTHIRHANIGNFVNFLRMQMEKLRAKLAWYLNGKIEISKKNYKHEDRLRGSRIFRPKIISTMKLVKSKRGKDQIVVVNYIFVITNQ